MFAADLVYQTAFMSRNKWMSKQTNGPPLTDEFVRVKLLSWLALLHIQFQCFLIAKH